MASRETKRTYCRFCHCYCAIEVDIENGRPVAVRGDKADPLFGGYTCLKGRELVAHYEHPDRLRSSRKRRPDGSYEDIPSEQAIDEIAERLTAIVEKHGPRAVAVYNGTYAFQESANVLVSKAFQQGLGSPNYYSSITIDQSAKFAAGMRFGMWGGGFHRFCDADVTLILGNNTLVSHFSMQGGIPSYSPSKQMRDAQERGAKIICVDPRYTEVARRSDMFLQIRPGEDPTLLAGMLRVILNEGLYDEDFCGLHADGMDALRAAVAPFSPEYVEHRSGVFAEQMVEAARLFAKGPRGRATSGTGPDMAPRGMLTEHLICCLNALCGRINKVGEKVANPAVLTPPMFPLNGHVIPPGSPSLTGQRSRIRDLSEIIGEMPVSVLPDEILTPGDGQVRALISVGGNPLAAWPNRDKTLRALEALDLLVSVDIRMSATARVADYVVAPKLYIEREDATVLADMWFEQPYARHTDPLVEPDGDLIEEWELFFGLAQRMDIEMELPGGRLTPANRKPEKFELLEMVTAGSPVPLSVVRDKGAGFIYEADHPVTLPSDEATASRFQLAPDEVICELAEISGEMLDEVGRPQSWSSDFTHLAISRRLKHVYNSSGRDIPNLMKKGITNPAYMDAGEMKSLGIKAGQLVEITSRYGSLTAIAEPVDDLQPGVISMAHAWGGLPDEDGNVREIGAGTNRLLSDSEQIDPVSGMPVQSALPVNVRPVAEA